MTAAASRSAPPIRHSIARDDEWNIEALDIDAYLDRIGYVGSLDPTVDTLRALHRAHATVIPFENLEIPLGRGVSLDLAAIQTKLVRHRRGGYCFEQNTLFAALLERLGFEVHRYVARVEPKKPGPRTHMLLNVIVEGERWHADVGFGAALLEPVPLRDGAVVHQDAWTHGVVRSDDGSWTLRSLGPDGWTDLYAYTREPQHPIDYAVYNHYTATHPRSPFVDQVVAIRLTPSERYTLRNRLLIVHRADGASEQREVSATDLIDTLRHTFGIELEPGDAERLMTTLAP